MLPTCSDGQITVRRTIGRWVTSLLVKRSTIEELFNHVRDGVEEGSQTDLY
jgi:hypothetical protein